MKRCKITEKRESQKKLEIREEKQSGSSFLSEREGRGRLEHTNTYKDVWLAGNLVGRRKFSHNLGLQEKERGDSCVSLE